MISAVPRDYRAFANSAAQTFANLFGYLPSPFLYGMIIKYSGGPKSRWGMGLLMYWSFWGLIGLALAYRADRAKRNSDKANKGAKKRSPKAVMENGGPQNKGDGIDTNPAYKEVEIVQSNLRSEEGTPYVSRFESRFDKFSLSNDHIHKMEYSIENERFSSERVRFSSDIGKSTPLLGAKQKKTGDMSGSAQLIGGNANNQGRFRKVLYSSQHPVRNNSMFNFSFNPNIMVNFPLPEKLRTKRVSFSEKAPERNQFFSQREPQSHLWEGGNMDIREEDERNNANETSQVSDKNAKEVKSEK